MTRPLTLTRDAEEAKISPFFIDWPVPVRFDTDCCRHGGLREVERIRNLWPFGDMVLPLAVAHPALNSITVLTSP